MGKTVAVIDTGFWSTCCRLGIADHLTTLWQSSFIMPGAILGEIFYRRSRYAGSRLFHDQAEFLAQFVAGRIVSQNPKAHVTTQFNAGERAVIDLALEINGDVLIDEQRAHDYALQQGLDAISVPEYVVALLYENLVTLAIAERLFQTLIHGNRSPKDFLDYARDAIQGRGGKV